jgi:hypothetical protein
MFVAIVALIVDCSSSLFRGSLEREGSGERLRKNGMGDLLEHS